MSNDLISRSNLVSIFQKDKEQFQKGLGKDTEYAYMTADYVINRINSVPVAYDVNRVCRKINENKDIDNIIDADHAIKIVKEGRSK